MKIFKHFFLKIPQWPDFKIFCGDWGGHDIIGTTFGSSCTFFFCWGSFKRVVGHHLVGRLTRGSMTESQVLSKFMKYKICLVNVQKYAFFMENILLRNVWVSQH